MTTTQNNGHPTDEVDDRPATDREWEPMVEADDDDQPPYRTSGWLTLSEAAQRAGHGRERRPS
jgi:hypothetical protein